MCCTSDGEEGGLASVSKVIALTGCYSGTVNMICAHGPFLIQFGARDSVRSRR